MTGNLSRPNLAIAGLLALLVGLLAGVASVAGVGLYVLALIAACAWLALVRMHPPVALGLWMLAAVNALPGPNLNSLSLAGRFRPWDGLFVALILATPVAARARRKSRLRMRVPRWLILVAVLMTMWWALTLLRSVLNDAVPFKLAVLFGRDLLFLPWVAVCSTFFLRGAADAMTVLKTGMVGVSFFAAGYIVTAVGGINAGWLVHNYQLGEAVGNVRVYASGNDLVTALFPVALWLSVYLSGRPSLLYRLLALLFGVEVLVQFTRATYLGVALGLLVSGALAFSSPVFPRLRDKLVRLLSVIAAGVALPLLLFTVATPKLVESAVGGNSVAKRIISIQQDITGSHSRASGGNSLSYRLSIAGKLENHLGTNWMWGLGFIHPQLGRFPDLPDGTIRNVDVGSLGIVMVFGLVGLGLILFTPARTMWTLARRRPHRDPASAAASLGLVAFLAGALAASVTLVTFFLPTTASMSGVLAACGLALAYDTKRSLTADGAGVHE